MFEANISTAKNNFCSYLERVQQGETIIIMDRKHPVATLSPYQIPKISKGWSDRIALLSKANKITLPRSFRNNNSQAPLSTKKQAHLVDALLEERSASR